ncbi:SIR2 family protein [Arthrobacter sp. SDTb3-6]|uniref:SIR2 family protein n=1 Tax=Arthrobacter sp. SDTb3-6 TaxID=2713571 RepID=UPI00159D792C|nr:hypothetical protein [Arthrobacter sp. SDTb3-6]
MKIQELAAAIQPSRTTLLFGAGASMTSGAPSGAALANVLANRLGRAQGDDLAEIAQIFENKRGRAELIKIVRESLAGLKPTAGLLTLPNFNWLSIYSTNFDTLIEDSYRAAGRNLDVYRSNFDVSKPRTTTTPLYKIHGCVTQDSSGGHYSRMLITESDYDDFDKYRQTLFNALTADMFTADTVIVGQSLNDRHLKELVKKVVGLRSEGVQGRVFLMVHTYDEDRAGLFTRLGVEVISGDLEDLLLALMTEGKSSQEAAYSTTTSTNEILSPDLVLTTRDVAHASQLLSDPVRLFNGTPATYADICQGNTITRVAQARLQEAQRGVRGFFLVVSGARGVGKTTLARSFMLDKTKQDILAWEHLGDHPLDVNSWLAVETRLRRTGREAFLFVDDCSRHLRSLNKLVDKLSALDRPYLRVMATVESAKWRVSPKSQGFFSRGTLISLSLLERTDIEALVNLVETRPRIRALVEQQFLVLGRLDQIKRLRDKCSADMFVCLKNIFANDNLDNILLQEYAELSSEAKDVYRYVAAIQSLGGFVHRQLIMRIQGISGTGLDALLGQLDGIVNEYTIDDRKGIFGWCTRHDVIAEVIAKWKFSDQDELFELLENLIDGLNPSERIEMETAIAIATNDGGIARLTDLSRQIVLFHRLIDTIPAHRTPRRRLVRLYIKNDRLNDADNAIAMAERSIGNDPVIMRHKAVLTLRKSEVTPGIEENDRKAMLLDAEGIIRRCISQYESDLYSYRTLGEIGLALASKYGDFSAIDDAIDALLDFERINGDPEIQAVRRRLEGQLRSIGDGAVPVVLEDGEVEAGLVDI